MKRFEPCKTLKRFDSDDAYKVELSIDMDISPISSLVYSKKYFMYGLDA